jgi:hypothetical protein
MASSAMHAAARTAHDFNIRGSICVASTFAFTVLKETVLMRIGLVRGNLLRRI